MKLDPRHKTERLGEHIPGFRGYRSVRRGETDLLLRRYLAAELEKVRDRLADFIVGRETGGELHGKLAATLKTLAFLKAEIATGDDDTGGSLELSLEGEERLLDFDLVLLEKIAGLHTPLEEMEWAKTPAAVERTLDILDEGVAEIDELYRQRRSLLRG
jgi:hypothetical protein